MQQDLGSRLRQRHAKILSDLVATPVASGQDAFLVVGDGWFTLLDVLCTDLQYETDTEGAPQVTATQVKEKLGRLRFRVHDASERQRAMIYLAESLSERTCEACGIAIDEQASGLRVPRCPRHPVT